jgi:hypothetical protein
LDKERSVTPQVRIEVIVPPDVCEAMVTFFRRETRPEHHLTVCLEAVDVLNMEQFKREEVESARYQNLRAHRPRVRPIDAPRWSGTWLIQKTRAVMERPARFYRRRKIPAELRAYGVTLELVREIVDGYNAYVIDDIKRRGGEYSARDRLRHADALASFLEMNYPFLVPEDNPEIRQAVRTFFLEETAQLTGLD